MRFCSSNVPTVFQAKSDSAKDLDFIESTIEIHKHSFETNQNGEFSYNQNKFNGSFILLPYAAVVNLNINLHSAKV